MSFETGLYKVTFKTQLGEGAGLVYLCDGKLRGGDASYAWVGSYTADTTFEAQVRISRHSSSEAAASVFGVEEADVRLRGDVGGADFTVEGSSAAAPDVTFTGRLHRIAD